jgi:hypothetical protein
MSDSRKAGLEAQAEQEENLRLQKQCLQSCSTEQLLQALRERGGSFAALADAALLALKKGGDYNGTGKDPGEERDVYFPFGNASYAQMEHVKMQRIMSLIQQHRPQATFEGLSDTLLDLINYCSFHVDFLRRREPAIMSFIKGDKHG